MSFPIPTLEPAMTAKVSPSPFNPSLPPPTPSLLFLPSSSPLIPVARNQTRRPHRQHRAWYPLVRSRHPRNTLFRRRLFWPEIRLPCETGIGLDPCRRRWEAFEVECEGVGEVSYFLLSFVFLDGVEGGASVWYWRGYVYMA